MSRLGWLSRVIGAVGMVALGVSLSSAGTLTVTWAPNPPEDGVVGYRLCHGAQSRTTPGFTSYSTEVDVGNTTTYTVTIPDSAKTWYFSVVSYDAAGYRSDYSPEYVWGIAPPSAPSGIRVLPTSP